MSRKRGGALLAVTCWFMKHALLGVVLLGLFNCGGKYVEPGSVGSGTGASTSEPAPHGAGSASGGGSNGSQGSGPLPSHDLGDCSPGFDRASNPGLPCPWLIQSGQCFASNDAACACTCPTDHHSLCFSDFTSPGQTALVQCQ